jgi:hypothetical protein
MGYYYDWLERKWLPRQHRQLSLRERSEQSRRGALLHGLLVEISGGDSVSSLYAGLLARRLIGDDEELMRTFGKQLAELGQEGTRGGKRIDLNGRGAN